MGDGLAGALHHERHRHDMGLTIHYQLATTGDEAHARNQHSGMKTPTQPTATARLELLKTSVTIAGTFAALLLSALKVLGGTGAAIESSVPTKRLIPEVWIMAQPWQGSGQCLREMLSQEGQWKATREQVQGIGYWPWLMNDQFRDDEIRDLFTKLQAWHKGFGFEVPVLKAPNWGYPYPLQAKDAFARLQQFARRFKSLGMDRVDWFAFEEPIFAAREVISATNVPAIPPIELKLIGAVKNDSEVARRIAYGVSETVSFMAMMRPAYPSARLGLIEPYPALTLDELKTAVAGIQNECARQGGKGLDFFRLDLDWERLAREKRPWTEAKQIENTCHESGIKFSMVFWAADWPRLAQAGLVTPSSWSEGVLHQAHKYFEVGGSPDEIVIESWLHTPEHAVPETNSETFTASVLDFIRLHPPASWITSR